MCPEFERVEREYQKEADQFEVYPNSNVVNPLLAVKIYRRPAAGREIALPEDIRPPIILKKTLDYLFHRLLPASPDNPMFGLVQGFLWNRTRAIRQDFIVQGQSEEITIECHERIARMHILYLHWKGGKACAKEDAGDGREWSEQQELEQLRKSEYFEGELQNDILLLLMVLLSSLSFFSISYSSEISDRVLR